MTCIIRLDESIVVCAAILRVLANTCINNVQSDLDQLTNHHLKPMKINHLRKWCSQVSFHVSTQRSLVLLVWPEIEYHAMRRTNQWEVALFEYCPIAGRG